jgi:antirestriction protein
MTNTILWGRHPDYANGIWIKLTRDASEAEKASRAAQGFALAELPPGIHPVGGEDATIRIYVACLAAYNSGILHGRWIDATLGEDHIWDSIKAMLAASPIPGAEEYAVHDYEGFEGVSIREYESVQRIAELAAFIEEHGAIAGKLVEYFGSVDEAREAVEDRYHGVFTSVADFAQTLTEETTKIPENLQYYIDWERMGRDLALCDILAIETGFEEVHVFWQH